MKKVILGLILVLISVAAVSAQTKDEANFMAMERQAWDAFGKGDGKFFETFLVDEAMVVGESGASTKADSVKAISSKPCELKSYAFSNFKVIMPDKNTALVTYEATQDAVCAGQKSAAKVYASSIFVKRKGKWLALYHQETPAMTMPAK